MKTKDKILHTSLKLFNAHGIDQITVRDIAKEMDISHGNLCYHYPNTNAIIVSLYQELTKQINEILDALEPCENLFGMHALATENIFRLAYSYRFIFLNFTEITRRVRSIRLSHYRLIENRKKQVRLFFELLRQQGIFRKDLSPEQYEFLIMQCFVFGDSWISTSEIMYKGPAKEKINFYVKGYLALFNPYLTEKGKNWARL